MLPPSLAAAACQSQLPALWLPDPNVLGRPSADQTGYIPAVATLDRKKKKKSLKP
jgi:hypothetical protein